MTEPCQFNVLAQKWHLAYFVPIDGYFGQMFSDLNFKFVLPIMYINFDIQTKFEVNQTQLTILSPEKTPKMAIFQNPILPKSHLPKSLLLLHEFVWNFQNQYTYGFCTFLSWPIFDLGHSSDFLKFFWG